MKMIRQLIERGTVICSQFTPFPERMEKASIFLVAHDYPPASAKWWSDVYQKLGLNYKTVMLIGKAGDLPEIVQAFKNTGELIGGGFGAGVKDKAIGLVKVEGVGSLMGSVNTFRRMSNGELIAVNTDGLGFRIALEGVLSEKGETLERKNILMLGAGGTARAIAYELAAQEAELTVLNRTVEKALKLADEIRENISGSNIVGGGRDRILEKIVDADVVINALDQGGIDFSRVSPLVDFVGVESNKNLNESLELLSRTKSGLIVADILLRDFETALITQAKRLGKNVIQGQDMAFGLVVESFWWANQHVLGRTSKSEIEKLFQEIIT